jgi:hypothetical protein
MGHDPDREEHTSALTSWRVFPNPFRMNEYADQLSVVAKRLADEGKLIEAGWLGYRMMVIPPEASVIQVEECRRAFMAGNAHLFFSILTVLDPDAEPTEADLQKMELIHQELTSYQEELKHHAR